MIDANANESAIIFREELDRLHQQNGERFRLHHHLDDKNGFLTQESLKRLLQDQEQADFYICGPEAFMDLCEASLKANNIPSSQIWIERFVSPPDPKAADEVASQDTQPGELPEELIVELDDETFRVPYEAGKSLLACVRAAGYDPPSSCLEGFCGCCMAKLEAGEVMMENNDCLSEKELEEGWILTCQSKPRSKKIHIRYDE